MAEPTGRRGREDTALDEPGVLTWSEIVALGPAVGRTVVLSGQRLVGTVASTSSLTPTLAGLGSPWRLWALARETMLESVRRQLGIVDIETTVRRLTGDHPTPPTALATHPGPRATREPPPAPDLAERGRRLLAQSASLEDDDDEHPAFAIVLEELAPDELRILRVLQRDGDQPVVDVESRGPLGGGGRLVAERLCLLADVAGAKHTERLPVYLDNLERLRLLRVDDAPLDDGDYEVIEVQERAAEARREAARGSASARVLRRRFTLSAFGTAFCRHCLPA